ncbi:MAG: MerR family transcriptional regulator, partial [Alcanivorax sp.]|nr:MerR family transcriptional regulator [Alcanivorax sp.]
MSESSSMGTPDYSIQAISEHTGVLPVTLRAWERRYGLIRPARTARGHRRYSDADLRRIRRILAWLERGLPIGQVRAVLDGEDAPVLTGDPWRRAAEDGLAALEARNVPRLEQWFQRLVADYALDKVLTHCCDPLREHLRARPDGAAARLLLDSVLRQKLGGRALALAPGRRDRAWLVLAVGDPLPALMDAPPRMWLDGVAISPDGSRIAVGVNGPTSLYQWYLETGQPVALPVKTAPDVISLAYGPAARVIAT